MELKDDERFETASSNPSGAVWSPPKESNLSPSLLGVGDIRQNGSVNRHVSSSSLCSWSSFDTALTDDNSSGNDDFPNDDNKNEGLTLNLNKKVMKLFISIFISLNHFV